MDNLGSIWAPLWCSWVVLGVLWAVDGKRASSTIDVAFQSVAYIGGCQGGARRGTGLKVGFNSWGSFLASFLGSTFGFVFDAKKGPTIGRF